MLISRRAFVRSALAAAAASAAVPGSNRAGAQTLPATTSTDRTLGWALVGIGSLSRGQLLPALAKTKFARLAAVVSGHEDKGTAVGDKFKLDPKHFYNYETFAQIADDADVDVVYIVLPNGMHAEYTARAAKAGKHVFCEKPMANTVAECQQMIDACKAAGKRLGIAYRMPFDPNLLEARRLLREGAIGAVRGVESHFAFNIGFGGWRLDKKLAGGGPLMDIGIYSINSTRFLLGQEPVEVTATIPPAAPNDQRFKQVEPAMQYTLKFPGGVEAKCFTAYNLNLGTKLRVEGDKGAIKLEPAFMYQWNRMTITRDGKETAITRPQIDQFAAEIDDFSSCILEDKPSRTPGEEGLQDMKIIEALYRSASAAGKPVAV
jgi:predicted dehydrogenase